MENNNILSNKSLDNLSIEELVDLKMEVDDLVSEVDNIIQKCEEALNS